MEIQTKAIIYCRVSTGEQGDSKLGLLAQESQCKGYCNLMKLEILKTYHEVISGTTALIDRPVFSEAVNECNWNNALLVIAKQDRISRDEYIWHGFTKKHTYGKKSTPNLIIADSPNASTFEMSIRAAIAAEERKNISERTKAAMAVLRSQGVELGKAGREAMKAKRKDVSESLMIMRSLYMNRWSYRMIANHLNEKGLTNTMGKPWTKSAVKAQLDSDKN